MKTSDLLIRCLAMRENDQWVAICLDFDLAAQGDTVEDVKAKLEHQIKDYLASALVGEDREHAAYFLRRRAPLKYWATYAWLALKHHVRNGNKFSYRSPLPMIPAAC